MTSQDILLSLDAESLMSANVSMTGKISSFKTGHGFPLAEVEWRVVGDSLHLSKRELEIVRGIFDGGTEASIARQLSLSSHTVHSHLDRLYRKLHVGSRCALVVRIFAEYLHLQSPDRRSETVPAEEACALGRPASRV